MEYMGIGHRVKVTYKGHEDYDKEGIIHSKNGDFVTVNFGTHQKQHNVSNLLDLSLKS